jgi:predicted Rossmann-fold nucleotide-binding protein
MKSICVFCGSNFNGDPQLLAAVNDLAQQLVKQDITLVYGGGRVGVIPQFLMTKEVGHVGLTELIITENMHERKQKMADLSDGVITLPGGYGTMEEFFEVLTWLQLGLHHKPIGLLNVGGFYNPLLTQLDVMVEQKFLKPINRDLVLSNDKVVDLLAQMDSFDVQPDDVWFKDRNLI